MTDNRQSTSMSAVDLVRLFVELRDYSPDLESWSEEDLQTLDLQRDTWVPSVCSRASPELGSLWAGLRSAGRLLRVLPRQCRIRLQQRLARA